MSRNLVLIALTILFVGSCQAQLFDCAVVIPPTFTTGSLNGGNSIANTLNGLTPIILAKNNVMSTCNMNNMDSAVFAEAAIFDPTPPNGGKNKIYVYHPLIVDQAPSAVANGPLVTGVATAPLLPSTKLIGTMFSQNAVAAIWFGTNNGPFTFFDSPINGAPTATSPVLSGHCYSGPQGQTGSFIQFGVCNAQSFWNAVKTALEAHPTAPGKDFDPPVPDLGTDPLTGESCITTRDFALVDQDPSDNVVTTYITNLDTGAVAQDTPFNQRQVASMGLNTMIVANPSDQRQVSVAFANAFKALGTPAPCQPYKAPNLTDNGNTLIGSLALNEIHAHLTAPMPLALIPRGDPMVRRNLVGTENTNLAGNGNPATNLNGGFAPPGIPDLVKVNLMRASLFQPPATNLNDASTLFFCAHFVTKVVKRMGQWRDLFINAAGVNPGQNLFAFLSQRLQNSYNILGCPTLLDIKNPVNLLPPGANAQNCMDAVFDFNPDKVMEMIQIKDPYNQV